ncbi:MAG: Rne/Rng family ribonuclease [Candidatus Gastranaerophilales bacterium]|nr:Rne/Rng family ribonuclease [Candidatus Gastranaerophilales bacterium]
MAKQIVISERDNLAAVLEKGKVTEFFVHRGEILLNDVYLATVENILPSIDAAFVNVGSDKMGFLHASDVLGKGALKDKLKPKQKVIVQVVKEPTGHKGPRVTMALSLPGRFLVLIPEEKGINVSRKITSAKERSRLKSIVSLLKPAGVGVIVRTEAENQSESEIQDDLETLLEKWSSIVNSSDMVEPPSLLYRDQDLLYRVIREACSDEIDEIILDTSFAHHRANQILQAWNMGKNIKLSVHKDTQPILITTGIDKEIKAALQTKVNMPSGGYLYIQPTEALTVIDVNSGKFTSSATQAETIKKTNLEAVNEIARQLKLRNIGGMIIIDFIDMENRTDKLTVLEALEMAIETDKAKPTIGQISDLGLVELTRHRQGQSLYEIFTKTCPHCQGNGHLLLDLSFASSPQETEQSIKSAKNKLLQRQKPNNNAPKNKTISTNPSQAAKAMVAEPAADEEFKLEQKDIENYFSQNEGLVNNAQNVKIKGVNPGVVKKHLDEDFAKDTFTLLEEIQEEPPKTQAVQEESQDKPNANKRPQQQRKPMGPRRPQKRKPQPKNDGAENETPKSE